MISSNSSATVVYSLCYEKRILCIVFYFSMSLFIFLQGVLHTDLLSVDLKTKAELIYANMMQIMEQFLVWSSVLVVGHVFR